MPSYLAYEEPDIITILIQSSFLLVLNVVNYVFDSVIFCGLVGQIFVGVAWGTPGGKLLNEEVEHVVTQLGYLGLILLVYEGGLSTDFRAVKANAVLSSAVAATGVGMPIALSFSLQGLVDATPLQAFAAGAALCSTSLGTTFTILSTSGLSATRLGTVLTSAAMMDDVVGLVMVQVITNLGSSDFTAVTVVRPVMVSIAFVIAAVLTCRFVAKPCTLWLNTWIKGHPSGYIARLFQATYTSFIIHTAILIGMVTGSSYAGTSNLYAAYLAGASISWWDSEVSSEPKSGTVQQTSQDVIIQGNTDLRLDSSQVPEQGLEIPPRRRDSNSPASDTSKTTSGVDSPYPEATPSPKPYIPPPTSRSSGSAVFQKHYAPSLHFILKPLFFASIGFAIPITNMFSRHIIWRGIVYTLLMLLGKLITGIWLIRLPTLIIPRLNPATRKHLLSRPWRFPHSNKPFTTSTCTPKRPSEDLTHQPSSNATELQQTSASSSRANHTTDSAPASSPPHIAKPLSLYPAALLGTAMTARGEIGFLIASLAESTGINRLKAKDGAASGFDFVSDTGTGTGSSPVSSSASEIYLVVTWAIMLCTVIGPLAVGSLVKRVRRLERETVGAGGTDGDAVVVDARGRDRENGGNGPLGVWGVGYS